MASYDPASHFKELASKFDVTNRFGDSMKKFVKNLEPINKLKKIGNKLDVTKSIQQKLKQMQAKPDIEKQLAKSLHKRKKI